MSKPLILKLTLAHKIRIPLTASGRHHLQLMSPQVTLELGDLLELLAAKRVPEDAILDLFSGPLELLLPDQDTEIREDYPVITNPMLRDHLASAAARAAQASK
jgi:hypothetical protein